MAEEEYQKALEKHLIKIVPESEKVKIRVYGQTAEEEKRKAKEIFEKIRFRDKLPK